MIISVVLALLPSCAAQVPRERLPFRVRTVVPNPFQNGYCAIQDLKLSEVQGLKIYAPDGLRYLINKKDEEGTVQVYVSNDGGPTLNCITCEEHPNGPKRERFKMQPKWHPSGKWIFLVVERDEYTPPPFLGLFRWYVEGQLQNGLWTNMWAVSPDGQDWHRLTDYKSGAEGAPDGFTGPALTPDGKHAVWSQIVDGNILKYYPFGRWELILADFEENNGIPSYTNQRDITPDGMHWNEPGNFRPDNETFIFSGSDLDDAQGMDQYTLNIRTGVLTNLTRSPTVWDEHGVFSPDGEKIVFMSAHPYRDNPNASKVFSIKTEFMLMDYQTGRLAQLTRFREPGHPEYSTAGGIAANGAWSPDGRALSLVRLFFPEHEFWDIKFQGTCGNQDPR